MSNEHASEGVEHIQRAARELIGAARSFLDAAEDVVEDRELIGEAAGVLRNLARDFGAGIREHDGDDGDRGGSAPEADDSGDNVDADLRDGDSPRSAPATPDAAGPEPGAGARSTRVRRIDVE